MTFHSVFQKPGGEPYFYDGLSSSTLEEEIKIAKEMADTAVFGEYLYSRQVACMPLRQDQFYHFKANNISIKWRKDDEELQAPFDYAPITGRQVDTAYLPLYQPAVVEGLNVTRNVMIWLVLDQARSFKLNDLFKEHVFKVVCQDGCVELHGFKTAFLHPNPSVKIPLTFK